MGVDLARRPATYNQFMRLNRLLFALLAIVGLVVGWNWWTSDARRIERRLGALTDAVAKSGKENQLTLALRAEQVAGFFAQPFSFRARQFDFETDDRGALTRAVAGYRLRSDRISPAVLHRELEVDSTTRSARMQIVVRFAGGLANRGSEAYRFQLNWVEQQGEWKIGFADLIEIVPASVL